MAEKYVLWKGLLKAGEELTAWQEFFVKYSDRILYGTDTNSLKKNNVEIHRLVREAISHDKTEFEITCYNTQRIKGLSLDEKTLQKICFDNFYAVLGEPKEVNTQLLVQYARRLQKDINLFEEDRISTMTNWLDRFFNQY